MADRQVGVFGLARRFATSKSALALADQAAVSGTNFATAVLVGRLCGKHGLGAYSLGFTIVVLLFCTQEALLTTPFVIRGARRATRERSAMAGSLLLALAMLTALAIVGLALAAGLSSMVLAASRLTPVLWALAAVTPFLLLREFGRRFCFAGLDMASALALDLAAMMLQIVFLGALAVLDRLTPATALLAAGLASSIAGVVWIVVSRTQFAPQRARFADDMRGYWSLGRWLFAGQFTWTLNAYILHWLLALTLRDVAATGAFAACMTLIMVSNPIIMGISNALIPRAAHGYADGGYLETRRVIAQSLWLLCLVMGAFSGLVFWLGGDILRFVYGEAYAGFAGTLTTLALANLARTVSVSCGDGLAAIGRPAANFVASLLGLLATVACGVWFMSTAGVLGAAYGWLIGCSVMAFIQFFAFFRLANDAEIGGSR